MAYTKESQINKTEQEFEINITNVFTEGERVDNVSAKYEQTTF